MMLKAAEPLHSKTRSRVISALNANNANNAINAHNAHNALQEAVHGG